MRVRWVNDEHWLTDSPGWRQGNEQSEEGLCDPTPVLFNLYSVKQKDPSVVDRESLSGGKSTRLLLVWPPAEFRWCTKTTEECFIDMVFINLALGEVCICVFNYLSHYCLFCLFFSNVWNIQAMPIKCQMPSATQDAWEWLWEGSEVIRDRKYPIRWTSLACSGQLEKCLSWPPGASELMGLIETLTTRCYTQQQVWDKFIRSF